MAKTEYEARNAEAAAARAELLWALETWIMMPRASRAHLQSVKAAGYRAFLDYGPTCPYAAGTPERAAWVIGSDRAFMDTK